MLLRRNYIKEIKDLVEVEAFQDFSLLAWATNRLKAFKLQMVIKLQEAIKCKQLVERSQAWDDQPILVQTYLETVVFHQEAEITHS